MRESILRGATGSSVLLLGQVMVPWTWARWRLKVKQSPPAPRIFLTKGNLEGEAGNKHEKNTILGSSFIQLYIWQIIK
jgi:hypothetical protein